MCAQLFALRVQPPAFIVQLPSAARKEAMDSMKGVDLVLETRTQPKQVRLATMEKLLDHPRLGVAMRRYCQFVPGFYAFTPPDGAWSIDETRGPKGTLHLIYLHPGQRIYLVQGVAGWGWLKVPLTIGARMLTSYRYGERKNGLETSLQTWTTLHSAVLGFLARAVRGCIKGCQDEFIAYSNGNIASFGAFAGLNPGDFHGTFRPDGDVVALRDFESILRRR